jgi:hypothetical protein
MLCVLRQHEMLHSSGSPVVPQATEAARSRQRIPECSSPSSLISFPPAHSFAHSLPFHAALQRWLPSLHSFAFIQHIPGPLDLLSWLYC